MTATRTTIAAAPGYDLVELCHEPYAFKYSPIVAWIIEVPAPTDAARNGAIAYPVCVDWTLNEGVDGDCKIVRHPDGSIVFMAGPTFAKGEEAKALAHAVAQDELHTAARAQPSPAVKKAAH